MKKLFALMLALALVFAASVSTYAITVDELVEGLNNYEDIKNFAEYGSVWKASKSEQGMDIDIDVEAQDEHYDLDFVLDGTILTIEASGENAFTAAVGASFVIDVVETSFGYEAGEYITMMNAGDISDFTVEKDGLEMKTTEDGGFMLKLDLSKKATAIDISNIYPTKEDLESYGVFDSDGSMTLNMGYVHFVRECWEGENVVLIGEKGGPTQLSYKTLLAVISILKGDDAAAAYAKQCPDVSSLTDGSDFYVSVDQGYEAYEFSLKLDDGYKYIKFTDFDDTAETQEQEEIDEEPEEDQEEIIPDDINSDKGILIGFCLAVVIVIAAIVLVITKKKKKAIQDRPEEKAENKAEDKTE